MRLFTRGKAPAPLATREYGDLVGSRRVDPVSTAPSAVSVVTTNDIRMSGARTIPKHFGSRPTFVSAAANALSLSSALLNIAVSVQHRD